MKQNKRKNKIKYIKIRITKQTKERLMRYRKYYYQGFDDQLVSIIHYCNKRHLNPARPKGFEIINLTPKTLREIRKFKSKWESDSDSINKMLNLCGVEK